jgi:acetyl/propionyl-CoA carboxylase alpha subunit
VLLYREPRLPGVRVDSGIVEGADVPVHYDPLLAKVIALAESRDLARLRLIAALRNFPVLGVGTNIPFLVRVLEHPRFQSADIDATFLDEEGAAIAAEDATDPPAVVRAAMARAGAGPTEGVESGRHWDPWRDLTGWRV